MTQPFADALSWVPKSRALGASLTRAHDMARAQGHGAVRLEHLLLALIEDPDASAVMLACNVDLLQLNGTVTAHLQGFPAGEQAMPMADAALVRILEYAVAAARQSRRGEVNGAIVLAAVVGEGNSEAARILQQHGLTFQDTVKALQRANAPRAATPAAPMGQPGGAATAPPPPQPAARPVPPAVPSPPVARPAPASMPRAGMPPAPGHAASSAVATEASATALAEARRRIEAMRGGALADTSPGTTPPPHAPAVQPSMDLSQGGEAAADRSLSDGPTGHPAGSSHPAGDRLQASEPPQPASPSPAPPGATAQLPLPTPGGDTWAPPARPAMAEAGPGQSRRMPPPVPPIGVPPRSVPSTAPPPLPARREQAPAPDPARGRAEPPWAGKAPPVEPHVPRGVEGLDAMPPPAPFEPEQLLEFVPQRLKVLASTVVEVKLPRTAVFSIAASGDLPAQPSAHAIAMPRALTMRLRSQTGKCYVETAAPETQFFNARAGYGEDDIVRWRWVVTAKGQGSETLALAVSMRSIGPDGVAIETRLPEQVAVVSIGANLQRMTRTVAGWVAAVLLGALVVALLSGGWPLLATAAARLLG